VLAVARDWHENHPEMMICFFFRRPSAASTVILSRSATVWEGVKANLKGVQLLEDASVKRSHHCVALKSTKRSALNTSRNINGSVGDRFFICRVYSQERSRLLKKNTHIMTIRIWKDACISLPEIKSPRR
jgi:hypothetical protein